MRLSVVIPSFDSREPLLRCLAALAREGVPGEDAEVIVADDGSRDGTGEALAARFPGVRVHRMGRRSGAYAARNAACALTRAAIVAFLDADCEVLPGWKRAALAAVGPGSPVVMGGVVPAATTRHRAAAVVEFGEFLDERSRAIANFATLNVALEGELARGTPFDARMPGGADRLLSWKLHAAAVAIRFEPAMAVTHAPELTLARRRRYAANLLRARIAAPTLPWTRVIALGPVAVPAIVAGRVVRDVLRLVRLRTALGVRGVGAMIGCAAWIAAMRAIEGAFLIERLLTGRWPRPLRVATSGCSPASARSLLARSARASSCLASTWKNPAPAKVDVGSAEKNTGQRRSSWLRKLERCELHAENDFPHWWMRVLDSPGGRAHIGCHRHLQ